MKNSGIPPCSLCKMPYLYYSFLGVLKCLSFLFNSLKDSTLHPNLNWILWIFRDISEDLLDTKHTRRVERVSRVNLPRWIITSRKHGRAVGMQVWPWGIQCASTGVSGLRSLSTCVHFVLSTRLSWAAVPALLLPTALQIGCTIRCNYRCHWQVCVRHWSCSLFV